jgi:hypothetical protein
MEKEVLTKIYLLRKVKPSASFVENMKESILQRDAVLANKEQSVISEFTGSLLSVFANSVFQSRMAVVGAFMFLFFFGILAYPLLPLNYEYNFVYIPTLENKTEEEIKMVAETDEMMVEVATAKEPIKKNLAEIEDVYRNIQRQVLGSMIPEEEKVAVNLTDKDIIDYHLIKIEDNELKKEDERVEMIKSASEKENYGEAFDMLVDILSE